MRLDADESVFADYLEVATTFWRHTVLPADERDPVILVEVFPEDLRVVLRNLTIANAIRRFRRARVVLVTGWDAYWHTMLWRDFDAGRVRAMGAAFGVHQIIDVAELVDAVGRGGPEGPDVLAGNPPSAPSRPGFSFEQNVAATAVRLWRAPRLEPGQDVTPAYAALRQRSQALLDGYTRLFSTMRPIAFVTSHVDYNQWGLAVETARRFAVPVLHVQQTGSLKAYALWPEHDSATGPLRAEITRQVGELFEQRLWPLHEVIGPSAELVAHRSKYNLGRPSWWRASANSWVQMNNATQRQQVRAHVAARLGWDPERPVLTVFNHAVSDAVGTNRELFPDLAAWFEQTADYAARTDGVNWLFLDHPSQALYDETGFFEALAARHGGAGHLAFRPSEALSKNAIWSLTDLGVTVRGSVSNELPAYGIPVLQAGWSEWSSCGLSIVASDQDDYWSRLAGCIATLCSDQPVITPEQVERARLWMWFYRAGADVVSPLCPHWENLTTNEVLLFLQVSMRYVEADGDPMFAAVRRLWRNREPVLSGVDFSSADAVEDAVLPRGER